MTHTHRSQTFLAVALALTVVIFWISWTSQRVQAIQDSEDFPPPFGLAPGQTARLTLFNSGETAIVGPEYRFLNSRGDILARSEDRIVILPGHFRSFDVDLPNPPPGTVDLFGRIQMRVVVTTIGNADTKTLRTSVEVFDNDTGKTGFIMQVLPQD